MYKSTQHPDEITVVSAYFNLGTFLKKPYGVRGLKQYKDWMQRLAQVKNSMVIYLDDKEIMIYLKSIRSAALGSLTKFVNLNRSDLWSFGMKENISKIYSIPGYPKYYPSTVIPEYTCTMHAKFEVMSHAVRSNFFRTKYFAWMDVGYFRNRSLNDKAFSLGRPPGFDPARIAYTEMYPFNPNLTPKEITLKFITWVSAGFFVGRDDVMLRWVNQYKQYAQIMLKDGLMNTDETLIYSMFNDRRNNNSVQIQTYKRRSKYLWFTLGNLCIKGVKQPL
ncbi:uncharacterized protein LOC110251069 [Exaiptasia diaphana]|uniref:Uncharacterized protein n=1 Tax=Exaiptasia diaphana TaxID=2652724 RepID=A0A913Y1Y2_EXADI|nr:uncharacterized protein LOC110251069 [Exaiptasia diaphana]